MLSIDHQHLLAEAPARLALTLTPQREAGLSFLVSSLAADPAVTMIRQSAYILATIRWETAQTFQPIRERRARRATNPRHWEIQNRYWPSGFYGRGYVQITWESNYRRAGRRLAGHTLIVDGVERRVEDETFVENPDLVLDPQIAYLVCVRGMTEGWFTGRKLDHYIREGSPPDYLNARRVVNGLDRAAEIAAYANQFELLLRAAAAPVVPTVTPSVVAAHVPPPQPVLRPGRLA